MQLTLRTWGNYLGNIVDFISFALVFVLLGMVCASYRYDVILAVGAVEMLLLFIRLVFFASMTDSMGGLVRMVVSIIKDMKHFFIMLGMLFGGFAIAFYVLLVRLCRILVVLRAELLVSIWHHVAQPALNLHAPFLRDQPPLVIDARH
ncbi:hypothetical protein Agub_g12478 [Astrephomene gubernaculifera]|uniref:Uncharacterized protein n=1 Tax=Astrephomene gubernaculifera TaxID=47775 RepID=A0AAD3E0B1_9CHLO|nr:hypothetical protein Agub_g12478 [Astrephomene gubernaculifera]